MRPKSGLPPRTSAHFPICTHARPPAHTRGKCWRTMGTSAAVRGGKVVEVLQ
jgi:hypothetical protein